MLQNVTGTAVYVSMDVQPAGTTIHVRIAVTVNAKQRRVTVMMESALMDV